MERQKLHIQKNTLQETLILPLYARKLCMELFPSLYHDPGTTEIVERLDYDSSNIDKKTSNIVQRYGALEIAMRQIDLAIEVKEYLSRHPNAAVINMGCGLDQTAESCDNGTCKIYNIDRSEIIAVRNEMIPEKDRVTNIACDLNDISWFDKIDDEGGSVFFAAGVFYYFQIIEVQNLINRMAQRFRGGKMLFDMSGKTAIKLLLMKTADLEGKSDPKDYFYVDSLEENVLPWLKNAKASQKGYMLGYKNLKDHSIPCVYRFMAKIGDDKLKIRIFRIDFDS